MAFLDTLLIRNKDLVNATVYCNTRNTDLYINRKSFSPNNWKWGTLETLVPRLYDICSTEKYPKEELNYIETVFKHQNSYPSWVIDKVIKQVQQAQDVPTNTTNENEKSNKKIHRLLLPYEKGNEKIHRLLLPYQGNEGCNTIKSMNKRVNKLLPNNTKIEVTLKTINWAVVLMSKTKLTLNITMI